MLITTLAALAALSSPATDVDKYAMWRLDCPRIEDWRAYAPQKKRIEARKRAMRACRKLGASKEACNVLDVIAIRESSGDPCAVHVLGPREWGLGIHGLSVGLHLDKWEPASERPLPNVLRIPEVSAVVTLRIFRRAVVRYKAKTWREVGGVFAGRKYTRDEPFCRRLARVGIDCEADPRRQLGERLGREPTEGQDAFVLRLLARAEAQG